VEGLAQATQLGLPLLQLRRWLECPVGNFNWRLPRYVQGGKSLAALWTHYAASEGEVATTIAMG